jgi:hypothetical protein
MSPARSDTSTQGDRCCRRRRVRRWIVLEPRGEGWGMWITESRVFARARTVGLHTRDGGLSPDRIL